MNTSAAFRDGNPLDAVNPAFKLQTGVCLRTADHQQRFIDAAVMAKLEEVRIIHGKGTGALREAVQAELRRNKAVKSFRLGRFGEGESGVTVVTMK